MQLSIIYLTQPFSQDRMFSSSKTKKCLPCIIRTKPFLHLLGNEMYVAFEERLKSWQHENCLPHCFVQWNDYLQSWTLTFQINCFYLCQWKPFKNDKKWFLFYVKSSFCSWDIYIFVLNFWLWRKTGW